MSETVRRGKPTSLWRYITVSALIFSVAVVVLLVFLQTGLKDAGFHVIFATFLGLFFTSLITVALMGLIFYSDRAGFDGEIKIIDQNQETK